MNNPQTVDDDYVAARYTLADVLEAIDKKQPTPPGTLANLFPEPTDGRQPSIYIRMPDPRCDLIVQTDHHGKSFHVFPAASMKYHDYETAYAMSAIPVKMQLAHDRFSESQDDFTNRYAKPTSSITTTDSRSADDWRLMAQQKQEIGQLIDELKGNITQILERLDDLEPTVSDAQWHRAITQNLEDQIRLCDTFKAYIDANVYSNERLATLAQKKQKGEALTEAETSDVAQLEAQDRRFNSAMFRFDREIKHEMDALSELYVGVFNEPSETPKLHRLFDIIKAVGDQKIKPDLSMQSIYNKANEAIENDSSPKEILRSLRPVEPTPAQRLGNILKAVSALNLDAEQGASGTKGGWGKRVQAGDKPPRQTAL